MAKIKIGYRVEKEIHNQMLKLAEKERWSLANLSVVAMEYYLKLRGCDIDVNKTS